jgi:hypothetical protein
MLTTAARSKATAVLARAESGRSAGNARLAVGLLNQATVAQARRLAAESSRDPKPGVLSTLTETDIPDSLQPDAHLLHDDRPGQP